MCFLSWESMNFTFKKKKQRFRFFSGPAIWDSPAKVACHTLMLFLRQGRPTPSMLGKLQLKKEAERMVAARQAPAGAVRSPQNLSRLLNEKKKGGNSQQTLGISFFLAIIFPIFPHINYLSLLPWGIRSSQKTIHEIIKNNSIMVG